MRLFLPSLRFCGESCKHASVRISVQAQIYQKQSCECFPCNTPYVQTSSVIARKSKNRFHKWTKVLSMGIVCFLWSGLASSMYTMEGRIDNCISLIFRSLIPSNDWQISRQPDGKPYLYPVQSTGHHFRDVVQRLVWVVPRTCDSEWFGNILFPAQQIKQVNSRNI